MRINFRLKKISYRIWLGLLTLFLIIIITGFPVVAQDNLIFLILDSRLNYVGNLQVSESVRSLDNSKENKNDGFVLLERGRNYYESGRFSEAIAVWQQAVKFFKVRDDRLQVAFTLSYLSNAYQELGEWSEAKSAIERSIALLPAEANAEILARILTAKGNLQLGMGEPEAALDTWKKAEKAYISFGDEMGILGSLINQSQALQTLGFYRRAKIILTQVNAKLQAEPDSLLKAIGLRGLGITLQVVGDLTQSQQVLEQSLAIAKKLNIPSEINANLFGLANNLKFLQKTQEAIEIYQKVAESTEKINKLEAQLNQLSLLVETQQIEPIKTLLPQIGLELVNILPSRPSVYARVNFAQTLIKLEYRQKKMQEQKLTSDREIAEILIEAVEQARIIKDLRAESYAIGQLGYLYEQTQQWEEAEKLTRRSIAIAREINATDIFARWQAQLGRILKQQGDISNAIAAYTEAVTTLKSLRSDLVAINPNVQFSFQENIEPVYRELVGLLLQNNPNQKNLQEAREIIEALRLAELDNFFREACLDVKPQQIDRLDDRAAVIYPIILPDRLEVILSLPGKNLSHYQTGLSQSDIEKKIGELLESLNPFFSNEERLRLSQEVYNWLVKPAESELNANKIETLVFVLDGLFRNLPMAALYDGQNYLVEKYDTAIAPSLQLVIPRDGTQTLTQSLTQRKIKILAGGITEAHQGFSALPGVQSEVDKITTEFRAKIFLNQTFTEQNIQKQLDETTFPIVHLATHGQFGSNSESTFILTWDKKINVKEFENLLRSRELGTNPIELLVLSACQTATGDKRAALGLAGVAVRSGAISTLATLWSVRDESTAKFMEEFYQQLLQGESKAKATRNAQLALLKQPKYAHPFYWAPFILVGSWL